MDLGKGIVRGLLLFSGRTSLKTRQCGFDIVINFTFVVGALKPRLREAEGKLRDRL